MAGKFDVYIFFNLLSVVVGIELAQVVMLSRHNIRTPLISDFLEHLSPNVWPTWNQQPGYLTPKGAKLEEYMGDYITNWLKKENLLSDNCPDDSSVYIYANGVERTRNTGKAFARGAFRSCNVTVHSIESYEMDPTFNPIFRNTTDAFKKVVMKEMQEKIDNFELNQSYQYLEEIIDLKNSEICKKDNFCSFVDAKDVIDIVIGREPNVNGPLAYANSIIDALLMSYYEGMPLEKVGWGKINKGEQWEALLKITKENQNVRFNSTSIAKHVAKPLFNYIRGLFKTKNSPKFTILYGHDSNLNSVMAAFGFKSYVLPDQYEYFPIGGKIVFQKWRDTELKKDLFKVNYVYQSFKQLREGIKATEESPQWYEMEINGCPIKEKGFCLWDDFVDILKEL